MMDLGDELFNRNDRLTLNDFKVHPRCPETNFDIFQFGVKSCVVMGKEIFSFLELGGPLPDGLGSEGITREFQGVR